MFKPPCFSFVVSRKHGNQCHCYVTLRCIRVTIFASESSKYYIIPDYNQQDAKFLDLFIFTDFLHISGGSSAHHQEHITVHAAVLVDNTRSCMYSYVLLMMGVGTD